MEIVQKLYQMFVLGCKGDNLKSALNKGLGGVIFFKDDIQSKEDFKNLIKIVQSKMLLDEYEETLDMINKFLKENHSIKYIVYGGVVKSINDGELHSVSPQRLIELYKLNPKDCKIVRSEKDLLGFDFGIYNPIVIKPRSDGNYNLKDLEENYGRYN